ncbi:MAG: Flp pilus assembly protein CpaB [Dehalococcoidia bacterium]
MIKNQALGGKSNKVLIFMGLFLGLVSAVLVVVYLNGTSGGGDVSTGAVTPVVVVTGDISAGTRITEEMVTRKDIAVDAVLAGAYGETTDVVGQVSRVPLVAGEQVIPTKVTATGAAIANVEDPPLAYIIPEGMRAVSVKVSSATGASGLIRPGDFVDVILTIKLEGRDEGADGSAGSRSQDQIAQTVLQNVQVLSIGQDVTRVEVRESEDGAPVVGDGGDANPSATSATLAVPPAHGEVLIVAETCGSSFGGRLVLSLRALGDSSRMETRSVWAEDGAPPTCAAILGLPSLQ